MKTGAAPLFFGGGLVRSAGGWTAMKEAYREGIHMAGDERLFGSSEFVVNTLRPASEKHRCRMRLKSAGIGTVRFLGFPLTT
jgi:hypothetical protein